MDWRREKTRIVGHRREMMDLRLSLRVRVSLHLQWDFSLPHHVHVHESNDLTISSSSEIVPFVCGSV